MTEKKYKFLFELEEVEGIIFEYETNIEPPHIGEVIDLNLISEDVIRNQYLVKDIYYTPVSPDRVDIYIVLGIDKP